MEVTALDSRRDRSRQLLADPRSLGMPLSSVHPRYFPLHPLPAERCGDGGFRRWIQEEGEEEEDEDWRRRVVSPPLVSRGSAEARSGPSSRYYYIVN